ncbi:MAG: AI-2E family transporter [Phycisphaerales bacterium]|nr:MAG: AI-2E family transporter [Phycisphaerales bacterium]
MPEREPSKKTSTWEHLHVWQIQPVRDGLVVAAVLSIFWLGYKLSVVTVPMLLALALAYLFEPLVGWMTRSKHVSRNGAALGIIIAFAAFVITPVVIGTGFATVQGVRYVQRMVGDVDELIVSLDRPNDAEARERVRANGKTWLKVRDYVVEQEERRRQQQERQAEELKIPPSEDTKPESSNESTKSAERPTLLSDTIRQTIEGTPAKPAENADAWPSGGSVIAPTESTPNTAEASTPSVAPASGAIKPSHPIPVGVVSPSGEPSDVYAFLRSSIVWMRNNMADIGQKALKSGAGAVGLLSGLVGSIWKIGFTAFLTAFFFYFFCTGFGRVIAFWQGLIPQRKKGRVIELAQKMDRVIAGFVRGRITISALMVVWYSLGFWLIGVPAPLVVGTAVGLSVLVPYLAGAVGVPLAILLMALEPPGAAGSWRNEWWWIVGSPIVVFAIAQALDDYVLTPRIQGKTTNMDTPTILFASIAGGSLMGVYGLLIAIPLAACIKILIIEVFWPRFRAWSHGKAPDVLPISER